MSTRAPAGPTRPFRYLKETEQVFEKAGYYPELALNKRLIGEIYSEKGLFEIASAYLGEAEELARSVGSIKYQYLTYFCFSELYKRKGEPERALTYFERFVHLKDSIFNNDKSREIAEIRKEYENEQKRNETLIQQQQIELLEKKHRINLLLQWGLSVLALLILLCSLLLRKQQKLKYEKGRELLRAQQELTSARLENLNQRLEFKNKELTVSALHIIQKNDQLNQLREQLDQLHREADPPFRRQLEQLDQFIGYSFRLDEDWENFRLIFEQTDPSFFEKIKREYPSVSPSEVKLCALLKLGFSSKQIATILGITPESVRTARSRLRKKMKLGREVNLVSFYAGNIAIR